MEMKFWHLWVYRLFRFVWEPLMRTRPDLLMLMMRHQTRYLRKKYTAEQRRKLTLLVDKYEIVAAIK